MNETYVINMRFKTEKDKIFALRLTGADPLVDDEDIKTAMQYVIDSNALVNKNGSPATRLSANIVKTETEYIDVA